MMGGEVHLHVTCAGRDVVIVVPTMDLQGDRTELFARGTQINFTFNGSVCHLFGEDEKNLEF